MSNINYNKYKNTKNEDKPWIKIMIFFKKVLQFKNISYIIIKKFEYFKIYWKNIIVMTYKMYTCNDNAA